LSGVWWAGGLLDAANGSGGPPGAPLLFNNGEMPLRPRTLQSHMGCCTPSPWARMGGTISAPASRFAGPRPLSWIVPPCCLIPPLAPLVSPPFPNHETPSRWSPGPSVPPPPRTPVTRPLSWTGPLAFAEVPPEAPTGPPPGLSPTSPMAMVDPTRGAPCFSTCPLPLAEGGCAPPELGCFSGSPCPPLVRVIALLFSSPCPPQSQLRPGSPPFSTAPHTQTPRFRGVHPTLKSSQRGKGPRAPVGFFS